MTFDPFGNETISLSGRVYRVRALARQGPLASKALRVVGGRAQVYQLIDADTEQAYALKVMLPAFRAPQLVRNRGLLAQFAPYPGFEACRQTYLTRQNNPSVLARYPDLEYASLMPWISGTTWSMVINDPESVVSGPASWEIAYQLVRLVALLERHGIAHCDLSGGNVMVDLNTRKVYLIDFDEVYWPNAPAPAIEPTGTPGYRKLGSAQWTPYGDRFALAILLAEMLGWRDERVRAHSSGDTYFTEGDSTHSSERYGVLHSFTSNLSSELGDLLERAWLAPSCEQCPAVSEWRTAIMRGRRWNLMPVDPLDRVHLDMPGVQSERTEEREASYSIRPQGEVVSRADRPVVVEPSTSAPPIPTPPITPAGGALQTAKVLLKQYLSFPRIMVILALLSGALLLAGLIFLGGSLLLGS